MKKEKRFLRLRTFLVVFTVAILVELCFLNGSALLKLASGDPLTNSTYTLEDFLPANWMEIDNGLRSMEDPILVIPNLEGKVDSIQIEVKASPDIPYIDLFYTDETSEEFNGNMYIHCDTVSDGKTDISVGQYVKNLRVDLGDAPGTELYSLTMVVNPAEMNISLFRVGTVLALYYIAVFLFSLQRPAEYRMAEVSDHET